MSLNDKKLLESIKKRLSVNYIEGTDDVILDMIKDLTEEACDISKLKVKKERLNPYIKSAVIKEYIKRGAEGMLSRNEGGISSSFEDIVEKMRNDIISNGLRRLS